MGVAECCEGGTRERCFDYDEGESRRNRMTRRDLGMVDGTKEGE